MAKLEFGKGLKADRNEGDPGDNNNCRDSSDPSMYSKGKRKGMNRTLSSERTQILTTSIEAPSCTSLPFLRHRCTSSYTPPPTTPPPKIPTLITVCVCVDSFKLLGECCMIHAIDDVLG